MHEDTVVPFQFIVDKQINWRVYQLFVGKRGILNGGEPVFGAVNDYRRGPDSRPEGQHLCKLRYVNHLLRVGNAKGDRQNPVQCLPLEPMIKKEDKPEDALPDWIGKIVSLAL